MVEESDCVLARSFLCEQLDYLEESPPRNASEAGEISVCTDCPRPPGGARQTRYQTWPEIAGPAFTPNRKALHQASHHNDSSRPQVKTRLCRLLKPECETPPDRVRVWRVWLAHVCIPVLSALPYTGGLQDKLCARVSPKLNCDESELTTIYWYMYSLSLDVHVHTLLRTALVGVQKHTCTVHKQRVHWCVNTRVNLNCLVREFQSCVSSIM